MTSLEANVIPFRVRCESSVEVKALVFDRVFDRDLPIKKRENLAAVVAALFCQQENNQFLLQKLSSTQEDDRVVAAMALGFPGNRIVLPALQRLLQNDTSFRVKKATIFGICGLKNGECDSTLVDVLLDALRQELEIPVLKTLLSNLKLFRDERLEAVFVRYAKHADISIQTTALLGLFFSCGNYGLSYVRRLIYVAEGRVRQLALQILERHGLFADVELILPIVRDADIHVAQAARSAIASLKKHKRSSVF